MLKLWLDCDNQSSTVDLKCLLIVVGLIVLDSKRLKVLGEAMIQEPCWLQGQGVGGEFITMFGYKIFHQL
jgi:hypothetical protein